MPWPVYSERFLHHQAAGWWDFDVPAKTRCVLTNLEVINLSGKATYASLAIGPILLEYLPFLGPLESRHVPMRAVAYSGERVTLGLQESGTHATLSGYLFADPEDRTGPPISVVRRELATVAELELGSGT